MSFSRLCFSSICCLCKPLSTSLPVCSLFISMPVVPGFKSIWELPFLIVDISRRYRATFQPLRVPWQQTTDNLHPSSFRLKPIKFVCHGRAKKSHVPFNKISQPICIAKPGGMWHLEWKIDFANKPFRNKLLLIKMLAWHSCSAAITF